MICFSLQCSVDCAQGNKTRTVYCQHIQQRKVVSDSLCLQSIKPTAIIKCQRSCYTHKWLVENWGLVRTQYQHFQHIGVACLYQCEAGSCYSKGFKYRNYFCIINGSSGLYFDNTKCDNSTKPKGSAECFKTKGCKPHWVPLPWGEVIL